MPGELWGVHGRTTTVSTVTQLLARIVPSMFQWYRNLVRTRVLPREASADGAYVEGEPRARGVLAEPPWAGP